MHWQLRLWYKTCGNHNGFSLFCGIWWCNITLKSMGTGQMDLILMTSPSAWVKLTRFLLSSTYPIQANEALTSRLIRSPRTESFDQNRFCLSSRLLCAHTRLLLTLSWSLSTRNVFSALVAQAAGLIKSSCT